MKKYKSDLVLAALLLAVSLYILLFDDFIEGGLETDLGSLFLPRAAALVMAVLAIFLAIPAVKAFKKQVSAGSTTAEKERQPSMRWPLLYIAALIAYWWVLPHLGFVIATILVVLFVAYIFNCSRLIDWLKVLAVALVMSFGLDYVTQQFLKVYLPTFSLFT